jgi:hypothetical protein
MLFKFDLSASDDALAEIYAGFLLGPLRPRRKYRAYIRPNGSCSLPCTLPPSWSAHGVVGVFADSYDTAKQWILAAFLEGHCVFMARSLRSWNGSPGTLADIRRAAAHDGPPAVHFEEV